MDMARSEREDLAEFLETLTPEEWDSPTLCSSWSIREVVAHMISYEDHGTADLLRRLRKARFRPGRINEVALEEYRHLRSTELIAFLRSHLTPRGSTARLNGGVGLVDCLIHHQDIRRPLGRHRAIPEERLRYALPFAVKAPPLRGFWHVRGTRVVATDLDWSYGRGPEARGPGESVLMVLAGRGVVVEELTGPGSRILQHRLK
jgi:uncharacterized protein (TIGR03083 family)